MRHDGWRRAVGHLLRYRPGQLGDAAAESLAWPAGTTKPGGMGLSISRSIIEAHGGRLWATMNVKHGATFHFTVPALV